MTHVTRSRMWFGTYAVATATQTSPRRSMPPHASIWPLPLTSFRTISSSRLTRPRGPNGEGGIRYLAKLMAALRRGPCPAPPSLTKIVVWASPTLAAELRGKTHHAVRCADGRVIIVSAADHGGENDNHGGRYVEPEHLDEWWEAVSDTVPARITKLKTADEPLIADAMCVLLNLRLAHRELLDRLHKSRMEMLEAGYELGCLMEKYPTLLQRVLEGEAFELFGFAKPHPKDFIYPHLIVGAFLFEELPSPIDTEFAGAALQTLACKKVNPERLPRLLTKLVERHGEHALIDLACSFDERGQAQEDKMRRSH